MYSGSLDFHYLANTGMGAIHTFQAQDRTLDFLRWTTVWVVSCNYALNNEFNTLSTVGNTDSGHLMTYNSRQVTKRWCSRVITAVNMHFKLIRMAYAKASDTTASVWPQVVQCGHWFQWSEKEQRVLRQHHHPRHRHLHHHHHHHHHHTPSVGCTLIRTEGWHG